MVTPWYHNNIKVVQVSEHPHHSSIRIEYQVLHQLFCRLLELLVLLILYNLFSFRSRRFSPPFRFAIATGEWILTFVKHHTPKFGISILTAAVTAGIFVSIIYW